MYNHLSKVQGGQARRQQLGGDVQGMGLLNRGHATVNMPQIGLIFASNVGTSVDANSSRIQAHLRGIVDDTSVEHGVPQVWCVAHGLGQNHWLCPRI